TAPPERPPSNLSGARTSTAPPAHTVATATLPTRAMPRLLSLRIPMVITIALLALAALAGGVAMGLDLRDFGLARAADAGRPVSKAVIDLRNSRTSNVVAVELLVVATCGVF